ncbi:MAG: toxin-antitoxin system YwqK family antitoxin [Saprospiraceae bacterium]|nr:toxin-antitoxin system YwqK family antitoxin [Saprospiraceae bacterium]
MKSSIVGFSLLSILFLISCKGIKQVETKYENGRTFESYSIRLEGKDSIREGSYKRFDDGGNILEECIYLNGKIHGLRKMYLDGKLISEETRDQDKYQGPFKAYHNNGAVQLEAEYINDEMTGLVKVYYPHGGLKETVTFDKNVEMGPFKEYHENGRLKAEGVYHQFEGPVEHGELKLYDTSGILIKIMQCDMGKCSTTWKKDSLIIN